MIRERRLLRLKRFDVLEAELLIRGRRIKKPYIRNNNCVEILAVTGKGKILLERSYRPDVNSFVYEIPAGTLEKGEDPRRGAIRELEEETGYVADKMQFLFAGYPMLGYIDCNSHFFLATGLRKMSQRLENDEDIVVSEFTPEEVLRMYKSGKIKDLNVLPALYHYLYVTKKGRRVTPYIAP
jgi:ADP-ribose pyrophosphatase